VEDAEEKGVVRLNNIEKNKKDDNNKKQEGEKREDGFSASKKSTGPLSSSPVGK